MAIQFQRPVGQITGATAFPQCGPLIHYPHRLSSFLLPAELDGAFLFFSLDLGSIGGPKARFKPNHHHHWTQRRDSVRVGMILLWSTTIFKGARPSFDDTTSTTSTGTFSTFVQLILLCSAFGLMSIGAGGIRSSTLAFGADQLAPSIVEREHTPPSRGGVLESFFNWYYFSVSFAVLFALTCIVYIQDHMGWRVGFGIPVLFMSLSVISFFLASPFYVKAKPKASLFAGFAQVIVAYWRNRHYEFSSQQNMGRVYHVAKGSVLEFPSEKLRFLNKACIVRDPTQDLSPDGKAKDPWRLCTIDQVEEFKAIINIIPLWSTGIILGVNTNQTSMQVLQANSMDRHVLTRSFEIPAGSFSTFALISLILWLVLYDRVIIPLASKAMGKPFRLDVKTRMGIGLVFSIVSMLVAGAVETVRRDMATEGEKLPGNDISSMEPMSALWLVPQVCLLGLAEAFTAIAQIEFFYSEFPKSMSSIASNLYGLGMGIASLVASLIMSVIDRVTKGGGNESWVSSDINKGHYDYYYWVLASLSLLNYMYFLVCSRAYGQGKRVFHDPKENSDG